MKTGDIFDERYEIIKILGRGGMSTVYLAENFKTGSLWAIKEIYKVADVNFDIRSEFVILKRLNHKSLPRIFDIVEDDSSFYIIEDYIEGHTLDKELQAVGAIEPKKIIEFAVELCEVLSYLHNLKPMPVIFRDMKPSNIILTPEGDLKLIDFGIAREYKKDSQNDTVYIGTKGYAAPEQYGSGQSNEKTDIYNLGMTLHHLCTGKNPNDADFTYKPIRFFNEKLPESLEKIIEKCTSDEPMDRYQNIEELRIDIETISGKKHGVFKENNGQNRSNSDSGGFLRNFLKMNCGTSKSDFSMKNRKKTVISCFGKGEFTAEFAYILAKLSKLEVLIINLNFKKQNLDIYLNLVPSMEKRIENKSGFGIEHILKTTEVKYLTPAILDDASIKAEGLPQLKILIDPYSPLKPELGEEALVSIIKNAYKNFDVIILSFDEIDESEAVLAAIENSDINIIAARANIDSMRELLDRFACHNVGKSGGQSHGEGAFGAANTKAGAFANCNFNFIAFEYKEGVNLSEKNIRLLCENCRYIWKVSYQAERERFRNINSIYVKNYFNLLQKEYIPIFKKLNMI